MKYYLFLFCLFIAFAGTATAQKNPNELHYTSSQKQLITIYKGQIFVNGNKTYKFQNDNIVYASRRNKLIEDGRSVFLFLEVDGSPNKNRLYVFNIDHSIADSVANAVVSDVKDYDRDGNLEFGGVDLTETYPSADSMYYVPSQFFEIKKGRITLDQELIEKTDIKTNGIYLKDPVGKKVIPKPKKKG
ncbi:hypothetical protein DVR12_19145 [Chitinophaga silvatica]|uniref:OstA-like protein n=1 Tax=Chitinophaga silvatica TaxID=2282649 RepID=A0A3E1Y6Z0_9BACT|nr:hypothetical protein [Chitinophaga silvatica]RFS20677.1 hypothetical protein DVR12_19145 [Chitinophaga silvatica]